MNHKNHCTDENTNTTLTADLQPPDIHAIISGREGVSHIEEIRDDLETLKEIIVEKVPTDQIWLFGSYAYGTPHKDSDIDIYIVMKDDAQMRELDAMDEVNYERVFRRTKKSVDILALKRNRFDYRAENFSMERKIKNEGVKIYG